MVERNKTPIEEQGKCYSGLDVRRILDVDKKVYDHLHEAIREDLKKVLDGVTVSNSQLDSFFEQLRDVYAEDVSARALSAATIGKNTIRGFDGRRK